MAPIEPPATTSATLLLHATEIRRFLEVPSFGRELFIVSRGGQSLGGIMQSEGLAHPWVGHKLPWC